MDSMQSTQFSGTLTDADGKRHIAHPFTIPAGCTDLTLYLDFEPTETGGLRPMLTLTLFDPNGFRGAGHRGGNSHRVQLARNRATPGYTAGDLPAGTWTVQIDTHRIVEGVSCRYQLHVVAGREAGPEYPDLPDPGAQPSPPAADRPAPRPGPAWYRGDLHGHTLHSDGGWTAADLVAAAAEIGLDFVTLTDHNTVSGLQEFAAVGQGPPVTLVGMELTTFWGHALCIGTRTWIDWRVDREGAGMAEIARRAAARGELFVIAHPMDAGDPHCTGCRWLYPRMMPGPARLVEVWNEAWWGKDGRCRAKNEASLALYYRWLNQGHRLVATAGSDVHSRFHYDEGPGFNVVYAEDLSEASLLEGIRRGHLYLSSGPELSLRATTMAGDSAMMGDELAVPARAEVAVMARWGECPPGSVLRLVADGRPFAERLVPAQGEDTWLLAPGEAGWFALELRTVEEELLTVTNPIFLRP